MRGFGELVGIRDQVDAELAYLAGLMADVGFFFFLALVSQCLVRGVSMPPDLEGYVLGLAPQHAEVGAAILERWEQDPVVVSVARHHHASAPPSRCNEYWCLSVLASSMAEDLTGSHDPTQVEQGDAARVERCYAQLSIGRSAAGKIDDSVRREFDSVMQTLG
jgi:HD-like signal output (HDOD) protein